MPYAREMRDRQYVSRKEGGRELARFEDSVDTSIQWHEDYIEKKSKEITNYSDQKQQRQQNDQQNNNLKT